MGTTASTTPGAPSAAAAGAAVATAPAVTEATTPEERAAAWEALRQYVNAKNAATSRPQQQQCPPHPMWRASAAVISSVASQRPALTKELLTRCGGWVAFTTLSPPTLHVAACEDYPLACWHPPRISGGRGTGRYRATHDSDADGDSESDEETDPPKHIPVLKYSDRVKLPPKFKTRPPAHVNEPSWECPPLLAHVIRAVADAPGARDSPAQMRVLCAAMPRAGADNNNNGEAADAAAAAEAPVARAIDHNTLVWEWLLRTERHAAAVSFAAAVSIDLPAPAHEADVRGPGFHTVAVPLLWFTSFDAFFERCGPLYSTRRHWEQPNLHAQCAAVWRVYMRMWRRDLLLRALRQQYAPPPAAAAVIAAARASAGAAAAVVNGGDTKANADAAAVMAMAAAAAATARDDADTWYPARVELRTASVPARMLVGRERYAFSDTMEPDTLAELTQLTVSNDRADRGVGARMKAEPVSAALLVPPAALALDVTFDNAAAVDAVARLRQRAAATHALFEAVRKRAVELATPQLYPRPADADLVAAGAAVVDPKQQKAAAGAGGKAKPPTASAKERPWTRPLAAYLTPLHVSLLKHRAPLVAAVILQCLTDEVDGAGRWRRVRHTRFRADVVPLPAPTKVKTDDGRVQTIKPAAAPVSGLNPTYFGAIIIGSADKLQPQYMWSHETPPPHSALQHVLGLTFTRYNGASAYEHDMQTVVNAAFGNCSRAWKLAHARDEPAPKVDVVSAALGLGGTEPGMGGHDVVLEALLRVCDVRASIADHNEYDVTNESESVMSRAIATHNVRAVELLMRERVWELDDSAYDGPDGLSAYEHSARLAGVPNRKADNTYRNRPVQLGGGRAWSVADTSLLRPRALLVHELIMNGFNKRNADAMGVVHYMRCIHPVFSALPLPLADLVSRLSMPKDAWERALRDLETAAHQTADDQPDAPKAK